MTMMDAANHVIGWLGTQDCVIVSPFHVKEVAPHAFRLAVQQLMPQHKQRVFNVVPTEIKRCWQVSEVV
jgi:hypothetical protein